MQERFKRLNAAAATICPLAACVVLAGSLPAQAPSAVSKGESSQASVRLADHTPRQVLDGTATLMGHYNPEQTLRLALALEPPHLAEERRFVEELQNAESPNFHRFLSAEEWNARFAPSAEDEQRVVDWAVSQGLAVTYRYNHRLAVDLEAPAGVIERAFGLTINSYRLPAADGLEERTVFSNDRDPLVPSSLNGVVSAVLGLNSIDVVRPAGGSGPLTPRPDYVPGPAVQMLDSVQRDADPQAVAALARGEMPKPLITPPNPDFYSPADLLSSYAYNYNGLMALGHCCNPNDNAGGSPPVSSIAIASYADVHASDIVSFQQAFPYLAVNFQKISKDGGYTCGANDLACVEVTADTEWALATANSEVSSQSTAKVWVYEGSGFSTNVVMDVYNQMLEDGHARVMTTSWGAPETANNKSPDEAIDNTLLSMAGQGWTLISAAGDAGATDACSDQLLVDFPASDPNVLAAGGTVLSGANPYEAAWTGGTAKGSCAGNSGGGGGGFSAFFTPAPYYQSGMGFGSRAMPDMALDAGSLHDVFFNGGWGYYTGTSLVAPMLAGFFAQENAYLAFEGNICGMGITSPCSPLGAPHPFLYDLGNYPNIATHYPFYDITQGCNSNDITLEYHLKPYCAGPGFDEATGWGSANMLQLAWGINRWLIPASNTPSIVFTGPAIDAWFNTNQTVRFTVSNSGRHNPLTGIAGFTEGWDSIPADPASEPHGGTGNSFYGGPQFPNLTGGCMDLAGAGGCASGAGQGCHTVKVEGWDNQGNTATKSYGPVCYDTVAPTITASTNPVTSATLWTDKSVQVAFTPADPGGVNASGIARTYYAIDTTLCSPQSIRSCTLYSAPFTFGSPGQHYIYYFTVDKAGNHSTETTQWVAIDKTPPVTAATLSGTLSGTVYDTDVFIALSATDAGGSGVLSTYCELDGSSAAIYQGSPLQLGSPGSHTLKYWSVDNAGNVESAHSASFSIAFPATLWSPAPGSTLTSSSATFKWLINGATSYQLWISAVGKGKSELYNSGSTTASSATVTGLPTNGATLYVRLNSLIGGVEQYKDYTYTEAPAPPLAPR